MPRRKKRKEIPKEQVVNIFCLAVEMHAMLKDAIQVDKLSKALSELEKHSLHRGASKDITLPTLVAAFVINGIVNEDHRIRPIIIVANGRQRQRYLLNLFSTMSSMLEQLGLLPASLSPIIRLPKHEYYCHRRAVEILSHRKGRHTAPRNEAKAVRDLNQPLTLEKCISSVARKICVKGCSKSCSFRENCQYARLNKELLGSRYRIQICSSIQYVNDIQRQMTGSVSEFPMHIYVLFDASTSLMQDTEKSSPMLFDFHVTSFLTKCSRQIKGTEKWCKGKNILIEHSRAAFEAVYALADAEPQLDKEALRELQNARIEDAENSLMNLKVYLKSALIKAPKLSKDLDSISNNIGEIRNPLNNISVCRLDKKRIIYSVPSQSAIVAFAEVIISKGDDILQEQHSDF